MDHPKGHSRLPDGWVAWLLVFAAMVPTAVFIRLGWLVFDGSWDGFITQSESTGMTLLGERWTNFWWASPAITTLLFAGLLPLLLLAVIVITDRPRPLLPTATARRAATVVAVVTVLLGLVGTAGFVAQFTGLLPVEAWPSYGSSVQDAFAPFAAVTFTYAGLSVAATAVLWPQQVEKDGEEHDERLDISPSVEHSPDGAGEDALDEGTAEDEAATSRAVPEMAKTALMVRTRPGLSQPGTPPGLPTPSASDLDLYRPR